jgi:hypothetical protein
MDDSEESVLPASDDFLGSNQTSAARLAIALRREGFPKRTVEIVLQSGYLALEAETVFGRGLHVSDWLYGSKAAYGLIPFGDFCALLEANLLGHFSQYQEGVWEYRRQNTFVVSSVDEAIARIRESPNAAFFEAGEMTFRGQSRPYRIRRDFPNPSARDRDGDEQLIIPSAWRPYVRDLLHRPRNIAPRSALLFLSNPALGALIPEQDRNALEQYIAHGYVNLKDTLVYRDLPPEADYGATEATLAESIRHRMWPTRYVRDTVEGRSLRQVPLLLQHYGIPTPALDVTFDLKTACFFALKKFDVGTNGRARFVPSESHESIVYGFVFHDPPVTRTHDLVKDLRWFEGCPPVRPIRQECALRMTDCSTVNYASPDVAVALLLRGSAGAFDLPQESELFPSAADDPFYNLLLHLKQDSDPNNDLSSVVVYDWAD